MYSLSVQSFPVHSQQKERVCEIPPFLSFLACEHVLALIRALELEGTSTVLLKENKLHPAFVFTLAAELDYVSTLGARGLQSPTLIKGAGHTFLSNNRPRHRDAPLITLKPQAFPLARCTTGSASASQVFRRQRDFKNEIIFVLAD